MTLLAKVLEVDNIVIVVHRQCLNTTLTLNKKIEEPLTLRAGGGFIGVYQIMFFLF